MKNKELRFNPISMRVLQDENGVESRTITGTAIVFNSQSELLSEEGIRFYEVIVPEAVSPELISKSDIVMLYNHEKDAGVLARSKKGTGTLSVNITETGVDFSFDAPKSPIGDNILESVKRGDLDACSFAFTVKSGNDVWQRVGDFYQRTINKIEQLYDFSIVVNPAYSETACAARGLQEFMEQEERKEITVEVTVEISDDKPEEETPEVEVPEEDIPEVIEEEKEAERDLTEYFSTYRNRINSIC